MPCKNLEFILKIKCESFLFFPQAARKEQRFKAINKSNRAAEKIVKNYLKTKALETVTKRKRYFAG